jgi:hypothetical protein
MLIFFGGQTFDLKNMIFIVFKGFLWKKSPNLAIFLELKKELPTFQ